MKTIRKPAVVTTDDQLGPLIAVARYMAVGRTWLFALKRRAKEIDSADNPSPFRGHKTCKKWIMAWLDRNHEFKGQAQAQPPPDKP